MPEKKTIDRAQRDLKQGKSASTAAGEFVHEEIEHIRQGKHGARSAKQAIAIGLSKARRAGVPLAPPRPGQTSQATRRSASRDVEVGQGARPRRRSAKRSRATTQALKREPRSAASKKALSRHAKAAARPSRATSASSRRSTKPAPRRSAKAAPRRSTTPAPRRSTTAAPRRAASTRRATQRKAGARSRQAASHA